MHFAKDTRKLEVGWAYWEDTCEPHLRPSHKAVLEVVIGRDAKIEFFVSAEQPANSAWFFCPPEAF